MPENGGLVLFEAMHVCGPFAFGHVHLLCERRSQSVSEVGTGSIMDARCYC